MFSRTGRRAWWFLLGTAGLLAVLALVDPDGLRRHRTLRAEVQRLAAENRRLEGENRLLGQEAQELATDRAAQERAAREELRWVKPGEVIYRLDGAAGVAP